MGGHYFSYRGVSFDYCAIGGLRFTVGPTEFVIQFASLESNYRLSTNTGTRWTFSRPAEIADDLVRQAVTLAFEADQVEGAILAAKAAADRSAADSAMPRR